MATILPPFPDAELVMMDLLAPEGNTVTATGTTIQPGTILIERSGGADDGITDRPRLTLTFYAATRQAAWRMCRLSQQRVLASAGTLVNGPNVTNILVDLARTATPPRQLSEIGRSARIVQTIVELHMRRQYPYIAE